MTPDATPNSHWVPSLRTGDSPDPLAGTRRLQAPWCGNADPGPVRPDRRGASSVPRCNEQPARSSNTTSDQDL